jgi:hypothetical protein
MATTKKSSTPVETYSLSACEFESICKQLTQLTHDVIDAWACRGDEADGLERILVPLHAARRNLETAVELDGADPEADAKSEFETLKNAALQRGGVS